MVLSAKSARKRRTSSSTRLDLPAPPVPVMPSDRRLREARRAASASRSVVAALGIVLGERDERGDRRGLALAAASRARHRGRGGALREVALREEVVDHPLEPHRAAVVGRVDAGDAVARGAPRSRTGRMVPPPPPKTLMSAPRSRSRSMHVLEVLDVPALVGRDGDALDVLLDGAARRSRRPMRLCPRWMTSAPDACMIRRMTLIAASCPSKSDAAVTMRMGRRGFGSAAVGRGRAWVIPSPVMRQM